MAMHFQNGIFIFLSLYLSPRLTLFSLSPSLNTAVFNSLRYGTFRIQYYNYLSFLFQVSISLSLSFRPFSGYHWKFVLSIRVFPSFLFCSISYSHPLIVIQCIYAPRSNWIFYVCNLNDIFLIKGNGVSNVNVDFVIYYHSCSIHGKGVREWVLAAVYSFFFTLMALSVFNRMVFLWSICFHFLLIFHSIYPVRVLWMLYSSWLFHFGISFFRFLCVVFSYPFDFVPHRQFLLNFEYTHHSFIRQLVASCYLLLHQ